MSTIGAIVLCTVSIGAVGCKSKSEESIGAVANLYDSEGHPVGVATLQQVEGGVKIQFDGDNLPPGAHGFHIHEVGKCELPDFASAGGHFNPTHLRHGLQNPDGPHVGDLPNLEVGPDGRVVTEVIAHGATLESRGDRSLLAGKGTALVIHAGADDQISDPSGNSGPRIACGVIERR